MSKWVKVPEYVDGREILKESIEQQIAAMALTGASIRGMAKTFNKTEYEIKKIMQGDDFRAIVKAAGDEAFSLALSMLKQKTKERLQKAFDVLDAKLEEENLTAAIQVFKMIDKTVDQNDKPNDTTINITLPQKIEEVIQVTDKGGAIDAE